MRRSLALVVMATMVAHYAAAAKAVKKPATTGSKPNDTPCPRAGLACQGTCAWEPLITECTNINYNLNKDYFTSQTNEPRDTGVVECGPRPTISGLIAGCGVAIAASGEQP